MKFFTRDLYRKCTTETTNIKLTQRLEDLWDEKILEYQEHLKFLKPNVLPSLKTWYPHDAIFEKLKFVLPNVLILYLIQNKNSIIEINYKLTDSVEILGLDKNSECMYDEFNKNEKGFLHNIMFTNCEIEIPFSEMQWHLIFLEN